MTVAFVLPHIVKPSAGKAEGVAARYPLAYACDFYRAHRGEFEGVEGSLSRGEAGDALRALVATTGENLEEVIYALADAQLAEEGAILSPEVKAEARARAEAWSSLGLEKPQG